MKTRQYTATHMTRPERRFYAQRLLAALLLPLGWAAQRTAAHSPATVESLYSRGIFRWTAGPMAIATAWLPLSVGELMFLFAPVALLVLAGARWRARAAPWAAMTADIAAATGLTYLAFLVLWGFNYEREPLGQMLRLQTRPTTVEELVGLCGELVESANALRGEVVEDIDGVARLADGIPSALKRAPEGYRRAAALYPALSGPGVPPKTLLLSGVASRLGISGIYSPFTGEANVNATVPAPDLPFAACHEMAHALGYAREDEANYLSYVACRSHPDSDFRYSGTLAASLYALGALSGVNKAAAREIGGRRDASVKRDLAALAAWSARNSGALLALSARVNHAYLRANGQRDGVRSYGRMVDLLLAERRERVK